MTNRLKEDDKNERTIRGLLKLPDNRRCINCNSLGPQYVCTSFSTFVCTTCSGIHREFTHRVKSVSMAKFTSQEVSALQSGGNKCAKDIFLKEWDPQRQSYPDSSNIERLRDFIKHVYVDRRYTGGNNYDKPPRGKMGEKEELYESRSQGGSRSPPYEDTYEHRSSDRSSSGGRSPGYDSGSRQFSEYKRSPSRPDDDWSRDNVFGNGESKLEGRSPERAKDLDISSSPVAIPVREILAAKVVPRISEPPKAGTGKAANSSSHTQRTASSSSLGSTVEKPPEVKLNSTISLIDFDADPDPPSAAIKLTQAQQIPTAQPVAKATNSANNNWASFDVAPDVKVSQTPSDVNLFDSVLSQLSVPGQMSGSSGPGVSAAPSFFPVDVNPNVTPVGQTSIAPFGAGSFAPAPRQTPASFANTGNSFVNFEAGQWPPVQHQQPSPYAVTGSHSAPHQLTPFANRPSSNQSWNSPNASNIQGPLGTTVMQSSQAIPKLVQGVTSGGAQPSSVEVKSSGRDALPEGLFTPNYPSYAAPLPGWQTGPPQYMGYNMQYNTAMSMPNFPQQTRSRNPFDPSTELRPQTQMFPSMSPMQSALPSLAPSSGSSHASRFGDPSAAWMPPHSVPHSYGMPSQAQYTSETSQRNMGLLRPSNVPPPSTIGASSGQRPSYGYVNPHEQAGTFSGPGATHPFNGNPFG